MMWFDFVISKKNVLTVNNHCVTPIAGVYCGHHPTPLIANTPSTQLYIACKYKKKSRNCNHTMYECSSSACSANRHCEAWNKPWQSLRDKRDFKRRKRLKGWLGQFIDSGFPYVSLVPYVPCVPITLSPFVTLVTLPPPPVTVLHCYTCYTFRSARRCVTRLRHCEKSPARRGNL